MILLLKRLVPCLAAVAAALIPCSCTTPASNASATAAQPRRYTQSPEVLRMEAQLAQEAGVRDVLSRRPGTRVKLLPDGDVLGAYIVEQREGKWFNVTRELSAADLGVVAAAVKHIGAQSGNWKAFDLKDAHGAVVH